MSGDRRHCDDNNRVVPPNNRKWSGYVRGVSYIGEGAFGYHDTAFKRVGVGSHAERCSFGDLWQVAREGREDARPEHKAVDILAPSEEGVGFLVP